MTPAAKQMATLDAKLDYILKASAAPYTVDEHFEKDDEVLPRLARTQSRRLR